MQYLWNNMYSARTIKRCVVGYRWFFLQVYNMLYIHIPTHNMCTSAVYSPYRFLPITGTITLHDGQYNSTTTPFWTNHTCSSSTLLSRTQLENLQRVSSSRVLLFFFFIRNQIPRDIVVQGVWQIKVDDTPPERYIPHTTSTGPGRDDEYLSIAIANQSDSS